MTTPESPLNQGKKSPLSGVEENAPIMSTGVTLSDDGSQIPSFLSGPFDLDGISEQRTPLVKEGQFKGALYDAYSGGIDNRRSTGNRVRDFLDLEPKLRAKAMCLEPGSVSPEVFWKEMKNGFAISGWSRLEICSNRQLEGDAFGWKVEDGSFVGAFRIEGIKWDLMDLMNRIVGVASDSQKHGLSISPTVFLKGTV